MKTFFEKRDRWGHGLALWVLVAIIFVAPLALWSLKQIDLHNDIESWLPKDDPHAKTLSWYHNQFEQEETMLVSWEGSSLADPRVARFAQRLEGIVDDEGLRRNGLKQVGRVRTPQQLYARMLKSGVPPAEALARLEGVLIGSGKLKVRLTEAGRRQKKSAASKLREQASQKLKLDVTFSEPFVEATELPEAATFHSDDSGETSADDEFAPEGRQAGWAGLPAIPGHDFQVVWNGLRKGTGQVQQFRELAMSLRGSALSETDDGELLIDDVFFAAGSPVALSVTLSEAGTADKTGSIAAIRNAAVEVGIPSEKFHMGGGPVAGSALNEAVKRAAWNTDYPIGLFHKRSPILLSAIVGIVLAFVMLRSVRLATLVQIVSYYAVLVTVSLVPPTGGSMNMVLVVMPTLLLVLTTSGAIHVCNYWKHAAYHDMQTAVVEATRMARKPCFLASITTAIGLLSLTTSPLAPVRDFGLYSAVGCLVSLVMVLYGLPALILFWPSKRPEAQDVDRAFWKELGYFLTRHKTLVTAVSLLLFVSATFGLKWFRTETKAIRYFPDNSQVVQDYNFLESHLAGIIPVELIVRFDKSSQDPVNGMTFFERAEVVHEIESKIRKHPEISGAISLTDFLEKSPARPAATSNFLVKARYMRESAEVERRIKNEKQYGAGTYLQVAGKPNDLYQDGDHALNAGGDELWRVTAQVAIMSEVNYGQLTADMDEIAKSVLKYQAGAGHLVTGMVPLFLRTQQAVLDSLMSSFLLAFAVIAVVMAIVLKNPIAGLISMLPNILPVGVVFGLISWGGLRVDIGTMVTASVALGIAVDGTLHLLTWFRDGAARGLSRRDAIAQALGHCGPAMWQTSAAVGVGLLVLYPADLLLISRFGWLMSALIGAALLADVILLPALLAGPLGTLIERSVSAKQNATSSPLPPTPEASASLPHRSPVHAHHFDSASQKAGKTLRVD